MSRERLEPAAISPLERQLLVGGPSSSNQSKPQIQPIGASPLLSQLKQFLPKMQQANAELQQKLQECDPSELDIEHIPEQEGEGQVIQMDLACGLLELHDQAAVAAAQRAIAAGGEITVETYDGGSSSDSDSDDSDDSSDGGPGSEGGSGACKSGAAAAAAAAAAEAAGASMEAVAMEEDAPGGDSAAAAAAAAARPASLAGGQQRQEGQQQGGGGSKQRRKLKPKRPMIQELP